MTRDHLKQLEADLWAAADKLRANSGLRASEYSTPVLGLIFLKFADLNYRRHEAAIAAEFKKLKGTRQEKPVHEIAVKHCGFYLPEHARYDHLLNLPEESDIAGATRTRDLLLPRLISGKLAVEDLEIAFPPGMAEEGDDGLSETPRRGGRGEKR